MEPLQSKQTKQPLVSRNPQDPKEIKIKELLEKEIIKLQQQLKILLINFHQENNLEKLATLTTFLTKITTRIEYLNIKFSQSELINGENEIESNQKWQYRQTIKAHDKAVTSLSISEDGKYFASVSWDKTLKIWDAKEGQLQDSIIAHSQGVLTVSFVGNTLEAYAIATGSFDNSAKLWSLGKEQEKLVIIGKKTLICHTGSIHDVAIAEHGARASNKQILVTASYDQTVKQWDLDTGKKLVSSYDDLGALKAIALCVEQELIASAGGDGSVTLWHLGSPRLLGYLEGNISSVESLSITNSNSTLAAGCADGNIRIWELCDFSTTVEKKPKLVIPAHQGAVMCVRYSQDGKTLYSCAGDGLVKLWSTENYENILILQPPTTLKEDTCRNLALAISKEDNLLISANVDGDITLWEKQKQP